MGKRWIPAAVAVVVLLVGAALLFWKKIDPCVLQPDLCEPNHNAFRLQIAVRPSKTNGRGWDPGGGPPDPFGTVYVDGAFAGRIDLRRDTYDFVAGAFRVADLSSVRRVKVCLQDRDLALHDNLGCVVLDRLGDEPSGANANFAVKLVPAVLPPSQ